MLSKLPKPSRQKLNREENDFLQDLQTRNALLVQEQKRLQIKLKNASRTVKRLKQEVKDLKRRRNHALSGVSFHNSVSTRRASRRTSNLSASTCRSSTEIFKTTGGCQNKVIEVALLEDDDYDDPGASDVIDQMQQRLLDADDEIMQLRAENERLANIVSQKHATNHLMSHGGVHSSSGEYFKNKSAGSSFFTKVNLVSGNCS